MKIIVGLGNPGNNYLLTRHNLGFMLIDALCTELVFQKKHKSIVQKIHLSSGTSVLLAKPQTFMNLSGQAIQEMVQFYKISLEDLLVIHDDKDLPFATLKFQKSRGHGGHNGIKDIHQVLNTNDYCRLKMGVGFKYPETSSSLKNLNSNSESPSVIEKKPLKKATADYVLSVFTKEEQKQLPDFLDKGLRAINYWIQNGYQKTSNKFNANQE